MTPLTNRRTVLLRATSLSIFFSVIALLFMFTASNTEAQYVEPSYSSYNGFSVWRAAYGGVTTICNPSTQIEYEYRLRDATTMGPLSTNVGLRVQLRYGNSVDGYTYTTWTDVSTAGRMSACVNRDDYIGIGIWALNNSVYQGGQEWADRASTTATRIGETGHFYYKDMYLNPRSNTARTVTPLFPVRTSTNNPMSQVQLHMIPNFGGATGIRQHSLEFSNDDTGEVTTISDLTVRGGPGVYTMNALPLSDGYIRWVSDFEMNGTSTMTSGPFSNYSKTPKTHYSFDRERFILDRVAPLSSLTTSITPINDDQDNVTLTASVYDYDSGPRTTTFVIENLDTGAVTEIDHNFNVHSAGFYGSQWGSNLTVERTVTLDHRTNYRMYNRTSDFAGNVTITNERFVSYGNTGDNTSITVAAPYVGLEASPTSVTEGSDTTLTWTTRRATSCTASGGTWTGSKDAAGNRESVTVLATTTYEIECNNGSGSDTASTEVIAVVPVPTEPPTISLSADNLIVRSGQTTTVTWSIDPPTDVDNCTLTGATNSSIAIDPNGGTAETNEISSQRTVTLTCDHPTGPVSESLTIRVIPQLFEM